MRACRALKRRPSRREWPAARDARLLSSGFCFSWQLAGERNLGDSVLLSVYRQYLMAIETHDLDKLQALTADGLGNEQLAKLQQGMDEKQPSAMLDLLGKTQPESVELVNEKIVGDRGPLAIQGYSRGDLFAMKLDPSQVPKGFRLANNHPIKKRQYELLLFKKVGGEWKLYRTKSFTYNDPRPLLNRSRARTSRNRNIRGSSSTATSLRRTWCRASHPCSG
jgi:hypothetical protein